MHRSGPAIIAAIAVFTLAAPAWASPVQARIWFTSENGVSLWTCKLENNAGSLTGKCGVGIGADYSSTGNLTAKELTIDINRSGEHLVMHGTLDERGGFAGTYGNGAGRAYAVIE